MPAKYIPYSKFKTNRKNPRSIDPAKLESLMESIKSFPKMMEMNKIVVDENFEILAGRQRFKACVKADIKINARWVDQHKDLTEEQKKEFLVKDNTHAGEWDWKAFAEDDWEEDELEEWGVDVPEIATEPPVVNKGALREQFMEPPFSVLDTKSGNWQKRKKLWKSIGIKSEVGREVSVINMDSKKNNKNSASYTSIFDPALCELLYYWFCESGGKILDPFAGGSVRGIVANYIGYKYTGIDIRKEQIESNIKQGEGILGRDNMPNWIIGDSNKKLDIINETFDFVFSCPPYADLEVYSKIKGDISNMKYPDFIKSYKSIIKKSCDKLKSGGFACFVVGDVRDKNGSYLGFVKDTIEIFMLSGVAFYNDCILLNPVASASMRAKKQFSSGKKVVKIHQNVLIFKKP